MGLQPTMVPTSENVATSGGPGQEVVKDSQTASDYIDEQLALEADAREILPYKFDKCTNPLGPLRQGVFACLTCSPPPASPAQVWTPAGVCYACSISCHGDHTLVELFSRRNFTCDCGTTRFLPTAPCSLRSDAITGEKGVHSQEASRGNTYNHNFKNRFCGCEIEYDADTEKGTMYQCLGLGTVEQGGCGEDWWHPHCLMGLPSDWPDHQKSKAETTSVTDETAGIEEQPAPPGFPADDDFASLICYKCVESNPWIKPYAGTEGFLPPLFKSGSDQPQVADSHSTVSVGLKRKAHDEEGREAATEPMKRLKEEDNASVIALGNLSTTTDSIHKHDRLGQAPAGLFSLLLRKDFREHLCHCPRCFPNLIPYPQLQEDEDEYQPSISESVQSQVGAPSGARSQGTGSILDRGEAALSTMDRVKAIEGVMVYNHLKDKVKEFLKPYAENGKTVAAEDIKAYFEKLRGDDTAIKEAGKRPGGDKDDEPDDTRREQSGY